MAAREAASGVVRGAAEGMRAELPELDAQLRALLQDLLTVLGRLAREAAEREHLEPGAAAHAVAAEAMQGVLEVLEREWQDGGMPFHSFVERLNHLLDEVMSFARSRADEIRAPGERAEAMTEGMVRAAVRELREALPSLAEEVKGLTTDLSAVEGLLEHAGRGLARGLAAGLREELRHSPVRQGGLRQASRELTSGVMEALGASLRRPLLALTGVGSALVALTWLSVRWRRA
jgi:hypothetical protein